MPDQIKRNIRLGLFVISGIIFSVLMLYMIGSNRNLFSSNFEISANFNNVNGLLPGNNVRLSGIDVGTVRRIEVIDDSTVRVYMIISKKMRKFIRKNSIASIGTDGLMGSKLVNINSKPGTSEHVSSGDILSSLRPIESDEMLRTLNTTNLNLAKITTDMKLITQKLNSSQSLWSLLQDSVVADQLKAAIHHINATTYSAEQAANSLKEILESTSKGNGLLGTLISDTTSARAFRSILIDIQQTGKKIQNTSTSFEMLSEKFKAGRGTIDLLLVDTNMRKEVMNTILNLNAASKKLDEDLDALKESFLLRRYFKKSTKTSKEE